MAGVHDRNAITHRHRLDLVVGHVDRRHPEPALQLVDLGAHLDAQLRVQVRERLVHEEGLRLAHDRTAHRDPLPLPARERPGLALQELLDLEDVRRAADAFADFLLRHLPQLQAEGEVLFDRHVRVERIALEDHRDVALLRGQVVDDALADPDLSTADLLEPGEHAQRRRLAAPGGADEHHQLAVADLQVEIVDGLGAVVVDLQNGVVFDLGHWALLCQGELNPICELRHPRGERSGPRRGRTGAWRCRVRWPWTQAEGSRSY